MFEAISRKLIFAQLLKTKEESTVGLPGYELRLVADVKADSNEVRMLIMVIVVIAMVIVVFIIIITMVVVIERLHWFQIWPPGCVTSIATMPWITLLALPVCIELSWHLHQSESHQ